MEVPLLGQPKEEKPEGIEEVFSEAVTAFIVFTTADGKVVLTSDINIPITVERPPTLQEIKGALAVVTSDLAAQEISTIAAQQVVGMQMQLGRQVMEAKANEDAMRKIAQARN